jgi:hypothetical protein
MHLPHTYEQLLIGWFMDAEGTTTMTWHPPPQCLRQGRGSGDKPSTRHPPLQALAGRCGSGANSHVHHPVNAACAYHTVLLANEAVVLGF